MGKLGLTVTDDEDHSLSYYNLAYLIGSTDFACYFHEYYSPKQRLQFLLITPYATSLTFNFSSFSNANNIITENHATIDKQVLRLTNSVVDDDGT
ncbi:hypothetical protein ACLB2K_026090 [Fragaria x ananassa]